MCAPNLGSPTVAALESCVAELDGGVGAVATSSGMGAVMHTVNPRLFPEQIAYIANHAGWVVAEVGRQPWAVYGLQRSVEATSRNVSAGMTYFTLFGFMGLYALVGLLYLFLFLRIVHRGPEEHEEHPLGSVGTGAAVAEARS